MTAALNGTPHGTLPRAPVVSWLAGLLAAATEWQVGECEAPQDATFPYMVVWPMPGVATDGPPLSAPDASGFVTVQVDAVGERYDQAQLINDWVRKVMFARTATGFLYDAPIDDLQITERFGDDSSGPTVIPEGDAPNRVWTVSERFRLYVQAG